MGGGKEGEAAKEAVFLVTSYTDVDKLAHTPQGEVASKSSVTLVHLSSDGRLNVGQGVLIGPNPAFALKHPEQPLVYVSTECIDTDGHIYALHLDGTQLRVLSKQTSAGKSTCFLHVDPSQKWMLAVSYWDAKVSMLPLDTSTGLPGEPMGVLQTPGAEYVEKNCPTRVEHWQFRQRWPHSHCIALEPYNSRYHFVTDLGLDRVFLYTLDCTEGVLVRKAAVDLQKGRGPRHILFHPRVCAAFIGNELDSTLTVLAYDPSWDASWDSSTESMSMNSENAPLRHLQTLSSLPIEEQGKSIITPEGIWKAASHSSELRLRPDGKFLYIGNRGHDSIAVYKVHEEDAGRLSLVEIVSSGGSCPRNFNFSEDGRSVLVGNQNSNTLVLFACCLESGRLTQVSSVPFPSPNYVYAVPS